MILTVYVLPSFEATVNGLHLGRRLAKEQTQDPEKCGCRRQVN